MLCGQPGLGEHRGIGIRRRRGLRDRRRRRWCRRSPLCRIVIGERESRCNADQCEDRCGPDDSGHTLPAGPVEQAAVAPMERRRLDIRRDSVRLFIVETGVVEQFGVPGHRAVRRRHIRVRKRCRDDGDGFGRSVVDRRIADGRFANWFWRNRFWRNGFCGNQLCSNGPWRNQRCGNGFWRSRLRDNRHGSRNHRRKIN